ncbi:MAG: hypothetical protein WAM39_04445, partial [Bryobacteraceae bacterium]
MRRTLGIGQPQHRSFARLKSRHCTREIGEPITPSIARRYALNLVPGYVGERTNQLSSSNILRQIGGNSIKGITPVCFAVVRRGCTQKAIERFLKKVIRHLTIGYLRAGLREVDEEASRTGVPEVPCRTFRAVPIDEPVAYRIPMVANARRFKVGHCVRLFV